MYANTQNDRTPEESVSNSSKCIQCGLVNFESAGQCKRCGAPLTGELSISPLRNATTPWRDSDLLVITDASFLPQRCVRCNSLTGVSQQNIEIEHFHKYNLLTLVLGVLVSQSFTLGLPLCGKHSRSKIIYIVLGIALIFLGISVVAGGFWYDLMLLYIVGFLVVIAGFVMTAIKGNPISVNKFEGPYLWLRGISPKYLESLPQWISKPGNN